MIKYLRPTMVANTHIRRAAADEMLFDIRTRVKENHQSRAELAAPGVTPESVAAMLRGDAAACTCACRDRERTADNGAGSSWVRV